MYRAASSLSRRCCSSAVATETAAASAAAVRRCASLVPFSATQQQQHRRAAAAARANNHTRCRAAPPAAEPAPGLRPEPWVGSPEQEQALSELRARFAAAAVTSDAAASPAPDDELLRWYLRDRYFNVDDAAAKLSSMLAWRRDEGIDAIDLAAPNVRAELDTGKAYVHSAPDVYGRPVVVIRVQRHVVGQFPLSDSKRLCGHVLDTALAALPPGGEQLLGVFDLRGFGPANADLRFAAFIVEAFFEYYPRRMGQVLMVDAPWVFRPTWEVIKPLLRKYSALVRFVDRKELAEYFAPDAVPEEFKS